MYDHTEGNLVLKIGDIVEMKCVEGDWAFVLYNGFMEWFPCAYLKEVDRSHPVILSDDRKINDRISVTNEHKLFLEPNLFKSTKSSCIPNEALQKLVDMGFERRHCEFSLLRNQCNFDLALDFILSNTDKIDQLILSEEEKSLSASTSLHEKCSNFSSNNGKSPTESILPISATIRSEIEDMNCIYYDGCKSLLVKKKLIGMTEILTTR